MLWAKLYRRDNELCQKARLDGAANSHPIISNCVRPTEKDIISLLLVLIGACMMLINMKVTYMEQLMAHPR